MKQRRLPGSVGAAMVWLILSGCTVFQPVEDPTRFYILDSTDYQPLVSEPREDALTIGLARVTVARYLESPGIAVRERGHELRFSNRHRWAEPLEASVARLVAGNLSREGTVSHVIGIQRQQPAPPDFDLHIAVSRAEGVVPKTGSPHAVFRATWELRTGVEADLVASGSVREDRLPWDGHSFDELAAQISEGTIQLSRQVAAALAEQP